jgi:2-C-methyl-D-erythritol 4-phosphate cytidylyltransferase
MTPVKPPFDVPFRIVALVPAAGIGARANSAGQAQTPKQYRILAGQAMLRHSVQALLADSRIQEVRVAVAPGDAEALTVLEGLPRTHCSPCGGVTRAQTVLNALREAQLAPEDWVLVHDAARPGLPLEALERLMDACLENGVGGLLAMPVADTLKMAQLNPAAPESEQVARTVPREGLWQAQTPQMFRAGLLLEALSRATNETVSIYAPTDEAQAMEALGYAPLLVRGSGRNTKITWPEDFQWVESWL